MTVSIHAIRRLKKHGLVPKCQNGHKAREYVKNCINKHTIRSYVDPETGATIYVTAQFTAVVCGDRVVTVYPNGGGLHGRLRQAELQELWKACL